MESNDTGQGVLIIGKSQLVLDDSVAGLRDLGYTADATNDFVDMTGRFDPRRLSVVVFGGQVPQDRRVQLKEEILAVNREVIFVDGLAGIPGLIISQVEAAFAADHLDPTQAPSFAHDQRSIRLTLADPATVNVTAWWGTSFVPPDPKSDSLLLLDDRLGAGDHTIPIPNQIPARAAFATVHVDAAIYAFSIATEQ